MLECYIKFLIDSSNIFDAQLVCELGPNDAHNLFLVNSSFQVCYFISVSVGGIVDSSTVNS